jgi:hypothetical protein
LPKKSEHKERRVPCFGKEDLCFFFSQLRQRGALWRRSPAVSYLELDLKGAGKCEDKKISKNYVASKETKDMGMMVRQTAVDKEGLP